jgi:hypothetical protein
MFHASHPAACAASSTDRSSPCTNKVLVQLLAAAITTFVPEPASIT